MRSRTKAAIRLALVLFGAAMSVAGCNELPGKPDPAERPIAPSEVMDFAALYGTHCAGCHGADGRMGAARPMNDPVYLAFADDAVLTRVTAEGFPDTMMPGFGPNGRGTLSDAQIGVLVAGMRKQWARPAELKGIRLPPYGSDGAASAAGDVARGEQVYVRRCAECHGDGKRPTPATAATGKDGGASRKQAGSIVDPSYLALVSDQALRSAVIAGRVDLGMPDWRGGKGVAPLSSRDIDDVVAWLVSKRTRLAGSPYRGAAR